jgi:uncharacterized surface protein with fasciclin (FAS1) repeats
MNGKSGTYTALAAAVALGCGIASAQDAEDRLEAAEDRAEDRFEAAEERAEDRLEAAEERADERAELADRDAIERAEAELDDADLAARREELVQSADEALEELRQQNLSAADLMEQAYGHAVFDATKGGFIITGAGGTGVARVNETNEATFMHLGQAGIGLGAGLESYKLVLLFENERVYRDFVSGQWDGNLAAQAAAGTQGVAAEEQFIEGIRAYRITDGGLMAQVDASGARYWPSRRLNDAATLAEARDAGAQQGRERAEEAAVDTGPSHPERLDELTTEHDSLQTFVEAVKAAGLADSLTSDTAYTVFAPTDEAFESMSGMQRDELLAPENREELLRLLRAHIVADDVNEDMARRIQQARTIDGGTVSIDVDDDRLMVGDATVIESDIQRGNLRIHTIDSVLASGAASQVVRADERDSERDDDSDVRIATGEDEDTVR